MYIAQELRKSNIAEYLLYMWQVEDTIRAFDCSLARYVLSPSTKAPGLAELVLEVFHAELGGGQEQMSLFAQAADYSQSAKKLAYTDALEKVQRKQKRRRPLRRKIKQNRL